MGKYQAVGIQQYAVVGQPVAHSRSPAIWQQFAQQCEPSLRYEAIEIAPQQFTQQVYELFDAGYQGFNVTLPHKEAAYGLADLVTERARAAQAANTLMRLPDQRILADNTDGAGLVQDLRCYQQNLADKQILILGAGGSARGVLYPLLRQMPRAVHIANRCVERAQHLVDAFPAYQHCLSCSSLQTITQRYDIVINATSASLQGQTLPLPPLCIDAHSFCYDLMYAPQDTPFMQWAKAQGATQVADGMGMLIEQAAESFRLWYGYKPLTAQVRQQYGC